MAQIIRQPPVIESEEIKVSHGKTATFRYTRNLYLDDIHLVYDKVVAICERVEISAEGYTQIPFELRDQVKDEHFAWVTIQGYGPRFIFTSRRGLGITIHTYDDTKPSEALFNDLNSIVSKWRSKPMLLLDKVDTSKWAILWLFLLLALPFATAFGTALVFLTIESSVSSGTSDGWAGAVFLVTFAGVMFVTSSYVAPKLVGNVIWYYRREAPKSPLHWPTILVNGLLLVVVAVVSWFLGYRWK